jgi:hypothetical protein
MKVFIKPFSGNRIHDHGTTIYSQDTIARTSTILLSSVLEQMLHPAADHVETEAMTV